MSKRKLSEKKILKALAKSDEDFQMMVVLIGYRRFRILTHDMLFEDGINTEAKAEEDISIADPEMLNTEDIWTEFSSRQRKIYIYWKILHQPKYFIRHFLFRYIFTTVYRRRFLTKPP